MTDQPTVSIVIPIHNEAGYLPDAVGSLLEELASVPARCNVILVENGSTDETAPIADRLASGHDDLDAIHLDVPNYGAAMRAGFLAAKGDWVVNFDIDYFSGPFLTGALQRADSSDIVLASKRVEGAEDRRGGLRRSGTLVFNMILKVLFHTSASDTHGMKAIRREVVDRVAPQVRSALDLYDTELVIRAERAGFRIAEVPVIVEERRAARSSFLRRVPRTLAGVLRIRWWLWSEGRSSSDSV